MLTALSSTALRLSLSLFVNEFPFNWNQEVTLDSLNPPSKDVYYATLPTISRKMNNTRFEFNIIGASRCHLVVRFVVVLALEMARHVNGTKPLTV